MNDSTKQNLDEITNDVVKLRKNNAPTYWATLILIGIAITGLLTFLLKTTGIILLVVGCFVYMVNHLLNAYLAMRKADKDAEEAARKAEAKRAKKEMPPPVVVEAQKDKTVRINLK